jgi:hypothetical protein
MEKKKNTPPQQPGRCWSSGRGDMSAPPGKTLPKQPLPAGWTEGKDPKTGVTYYYNVSTKASQWERPTDTAAKPPAQPAPAPAPAKPAQVRRPSIRCFRV